MLDFSKKIPIISEYMQLRLRSKDALRPAALIGLGNSDIPALVDTGSDRTLCFLEPFGRKDGILLEDFEGEPEVLHGMFGSGFAWERVITFEFGGKEYTLPVLWLTQRYDPESDYPLILGRDFLSKFDIVLRPKEGKVYFYEAT